MTASKDNTAKIWDATSGTLSHTLTRHRHRIRSAQFSPDGSRVVTASLDRTEKILDLNLLKNEYRDKEYQSEDEEIIDE